MMMMMMMIIIIITLQVVCWVLLPVVSRPAPVGKRIPTMMRTVANYS